MKKLLCVFFIIVISLFTVNVAFAHSGRTDSKGGHYNHSTREYHYHHGYGEHQHNDGFCPIEPENERYHSDWHKFKIWFSQTPTHIIILISFVILLTMLLVFWVIHNKRKKAAFKVEEKNEIAAAQIHHKESDFEAIITPSESNKVTVGTDFSAGYVEFVPKALTSYIRIIPAKGIKENSIKRIVKPEIIKLDAGDIVYVYDCEIKPYT